MKHIKLIVCIGSLSLFASCTGLRIKKSVFTPIDESFNGTFSNDTFKTTGDFPAKTMLDVFHINDQSTDSVQLKLLNSNQLQITYGQTINTKTFNGRLKRGYFEFYLHKKQITFPPIYMTRNIYRIRLALTGENELIVANMYANDGMILLFGGGDSGHKQYYFKSNTFNKNAY